MKFLHLLKDYVPTIIKTAIFLGVCLSLVFGSILGINQYAKYNAEQQLQEIYLLSTQKINKMEVPSYNFSPARINLETEDGLYTMTSSDMFKTINVKTLYGEDYEVRKEIINYMKKNNINSVKRGSLTYRSKGVYEAYDFNTKHTFVITYDPDTTKIEHDFKEID